MLNSVSILIQVCERASRVSQLPINKMSREELIDLMGKGPATRYVLYKGLSDN